MEFDKKTLLATLLIVVIFFIFTSDFYRSWRYGDLPPVPIDTTGVSSPISEPLAPESPAPGSKSASVPESAPLDSLRDEAQQARDVIIETPLYRGVLSTLGGDIKEWQFKEYSYQNGEPIVLVKDGMNNLAVVLPSKYDSLNTSRYNFACNDSLVQLAEGQTQTITFEREIAPGKVVRKTYDFSGGDYTVGLAITLENVQDLVDGYHYNLRWQTGLGSTEPNLKNDMTDTKAYTYIGDDLLNLDVSDQAYKELKEDERDISWAAMRTKYFACALIPESQPARGVKLSGTTTYVPSADTRLKSYQIDLKMPLARQGATSHKLKVYLGPLEYDTLEGLGVERIMNLGWSIIRPFSWAALKSLQWLHNFVPNYGLVIIIFSILVKIILHPLTKKSNESMKQMQVLQPKMKELQEKYSKEPQKLNEEMMKMYREYGVNPLGGCLPMLLQMPLLFAMFTVFSSTISFRQAPFFGWISDLSSPDSIFSLPFSIPFYGNHVALLPLLMGVTMFIQQKMSITDPKQKAMIYVMPIMFTLMFNNFPSGLNLYYALFNVLSIIQQKYLTKPPEDLEARKKKMKERSELKKGGFHAALSRKRLMKK